MGLLTYLLLCKGKRYKTDFKMYRFLYINTVIYLVNLFLTGTWVNDFETTLDVYED